ncbi:MAG: tetratricopeptide repeat protein [Puniceicoccaceae bacterium]
MRTPSRFIFSGALFAAAVLSPLHGQEEAEAGDIEVSASYEEAMGRYGSRPVEALERRGPNQFEPVTLVGFGVGGVEIRYPDLDNVITFEEDKLNFPITYRPDFDADRYNALREEGREDEALELLRAEAYPLLQYVPIDPGKAAIHAPVARLLDALLAAGRVDETASILESFPRDRLTGYFQTQAVEGASLLVEEGSIDRAYDLVKEFPVGPGETTFVDVYLDLANEIRLRGEWERARDLYTDVQLASSPDETPEAFLWEAYIHLQEDRAFMVDDILDRFEDLDPDSRYYSLRELVRGVVLENAGNNREALSALAKGVVYSTTNDPWTPELLFRTADLYESEDFEGAAEEIREQLRFFYPDSIWVRRLAGAP